MSEIIAAYGIGVVTTLIFVLIGCALEEREVRKTEANNLKTALEIEYANKQIAAFKAEREENIWQKRMI